MKQRLTAPPHINRDLRPTKRELRWFAHIDRHGPQSSEFLYELTRDTHRCRDTALRRLQALREAGHLRLPPQQRQIEKADFNPYVYDLTKRGWEILGDHHELERDCRPTGHWWHGYWVACVSSAIEVVTVRRGLTYIPCARILAIKGARVGLPLKKGTLIPDQLFAVRYPDGYRAYALEVDRGTEPVRSKAARKSLQRSVQQYCEVLDTQLYKAQYGLKSNMTSVWTFNSQRRADQFCKLLHSGDRRFCPVVCAALTPRFNSLELMVDQILYRS